MKILLFLTSIRLHCSQSQHSLFPAPCAYVCVCSHFDTCIQANHFWQQSQIISRWRVPFTQALPPLTGLRRHSCLSLKMSALKFCIYMFQSRWACSTLWGLPLLKLNDPLFLINFFRKRGWHSYFQEIVPASPAQFGWCWVCSSKHLEPTGLQQLPSLNIGQTIFTLPSHGTSWAPMGVMTLPPFSPWCTTLQNWTTTLYCSARSCLPSPVGRCCVPHTSASTCCLHSRLINFLMEPTHWWWQRSQHSSSRA